MILSGPARPNRHLGLFDDLGQVLLSEVGTSLGETRQGGGDVSPRFAPSDDLLAGVDHGVEFELPFLRQGRLRGRDIDVLGKGLPQNLSEANTARDRKSVGEGKGGRRSGRA